YPAFNFPDANKQIKIGFNIPTVATHQTCMVKNVAHRLSNAVGVGDWQNVTSLTADGWPLTIGKPYSTRNTVWKSDDTNGIDGKGFPAPTGTWTIVLDESNPSNPMTGVGLITNRAGVVGPIRSMPGKVIDGVEYGKTWLVPIRYAPNAVANNLSINFTMASP